VTLDGSAPPLAIPEVDFRGTAKLLGPRVYDAVAQRFYRVTTPTGFTPVPRQLALNETANKPEWLNDYHAVQLP
jgi:hypothetical protein